MSDDGADARRVATCTCLSISRDPLCVYHGDVDKVDARRVAPVEPNYCRFCQPIQTMKCAAAHPHDETRWCGACLLEKYQPERFGEAQRIAAPPEGTLEDSETIG